MYTHIAIYVDICTYTHAYISKGAIGSLGAGVTGCYQLLELSSNFLQQLSHLSSPSCRHYYLCISLLLKVYKPSLFLNFQNASECLYQSNPDDFSHKAVQSSFPAWCSYSNFLTLVLDGSSPGAVKITAQQVPWPSAMGPVFCYITDNSHKSNLTGTQFSISLLNLGCALHGLTSTGRHEFKSMTARQCPCCSPWPQSSHSSFSARDIHACSFPYPCLPSAGYCPLFQQAFLEHQPTNHDMETYYQL